MMWTKTAMLVMVVALAGCDCVTSSHPVGVEVPSIDVSEWEGRWSFTGESEKVFEIEVIDPANAILRVATYPPDVSSPPASTHLRGWGNDLFISVPKERQPTEYFWFRVANQDGAILLWQPDASKFRNLVDDGVLPGRTKKGAVELETLTREHLAIITSEHEGVLFDWKNPWVLQRVSP